MAKKPAPRHTAKVVEPRGVRAVSFTTSRHLQGKGRTDHLIELRCPPYK